MNCKDVLWYYDFLVVFRLPLPYCTWGTVAALNQWSAHFYRNTDLELPKVLKSAASMFGG